MTDTKPDYAYNIDLYNTFEPLDYTYRIRLMREMINWCLENIGESEHGWFHSPVVPHWRTFFFDREEDLLAFKLKFQT